MPDVLAWGVAIVLSAAASAVCVVVFVRRSAPLPGAVSRLICAAAVLIGAVLGHIVLGLWPNWPLAGALDRLFAIALPAAIPLQIFVGAKTMSAAKRFVWQLLFALALAWTLLYGSVYLQGKLIKPIAILASSATLFVTTDALLSRLWARTQQATIPLAVAMSIFTAGMLVLMAGYIKGGVAAFPWSAALAGTTIGAWLTKKHLNLAAVLSIGIVVLFAILFIGRFFGALTTGWAVLVAAAPLLCWVAEIPALRAWAPWRRECLRLALVIAALLIILIAGKQRFDRKMGPLLGQHDNSEANCAHC